MNSLKLWGEWENQQKRLKRSSQKNRKKTWRGWRPGSQIKKIIQGGRRHQLYQKLLIDQTGNKVQKLTFRFNTIEVTGDQRGCGYKGRYEWAEEKTTGDKQEAVSVDNSVEDLSAKGRRE